MVPLPDEPLASGPSYRRLPGRGRRTSGCISVGATISTIWLASDHLLLRESAFGMSETYKRFYYRDIQAIIIRRSPQWIARISGWAVMCLVFIFCWGLPQRRGWGWLLLSAVCFVLAMVQLARGPTCVTYLVTAVQRELLGSLNTLRKVRRAMKTLVPLIEEKQGKFDVSMLAEPGAVPVAAHPSPLPRSATMPAPSASVKSGISGVHLGLFLTTLIGGCVALWETYWTSWLTLYAAGILLGLILIGSVIALAVQNRRRVGKLTAGLTWTITASYIVAWIVVYTFYASISSIQRAAERAAQNKPPEVILNVEASSVRGMPGFDYVLLGYGIYSVVLGVSGMASLFVNRPRDHGPPPLPPKERSGVTQ
jgi:hypothetical protein